MHTLVLADDYSIADDVTGPAPTIPPGQLALGDLLALAVRAGLADGGTLALTGQAWPALLRTCDRDGTLATAGAWTARVQDGDAWIRWSCDGRSVWTCELDVLPPRGRSTPLIHSAPIATAVQLHRWVQATGQPWVGTPGMTGNALLIALSAGRKGGGRPPRWQRPTEWLYGDIERPYSARQWSVDADLPTHAYDANAAYLAAYQTVRLPADVLAPRDPHRLFDRSEGGIWRVDLEPWRDAALPDPAGYAPTLPDGTRWLTTPTLELIDQLANRGQHGGYAIREAWTAPARSITRIWAERLHYVMAHTVPTDPLHIASKRVYKETYGLWARAGARVYRPEWHYSVIAMARANLWRKMAGVVGATLTRVETDCLHYVCTAGSGAADCWATCAPAGLRLDASGRALGAFKPDGGTGR